MTPREVVSQVLAGKAPPYVPWSYSFTIEAREKLCRHYGPVDLDRVLGNHLLVLGSGTGFFDDLGSGRVRDVFGVTWDRSEDKDIGVVEGQVLAEPDLGGYEFPDPVSDRFFRDIPAVIADSPDRFRVFNLGFSLFERAWTLRGMESLLMDFVENPDFVRTLFRRIADYNIAQVKKALTYDIDAVQFGDDWGQQRGLIMGPDFWHEFIFPEIKRMYGVVKAAGKAVFIHSCGDVDELFDDLVSIGLDCFNPFQPEVMDVFSLIEQYRGRLSFYGGLSTQQTLPYGTVEEVISETKRLLAAGRAGNYIFAPAHSVEGDVPLENMLAFIETLRNQSNCRI